MKQDRHIQEDINQTLMVKAINDRNKERYEQLIRDDKLASYKVMI